MPLVIGIDPGSSSGWCVAIDGVSYYSEVSLKADNRTLLKWFYDHKDADACGVELVHARSGFNITTQAKMVGSMERAIMAADACLGLDVPVWRFRPQEWQTHFNLIFHTDKSLSAHRRKKLKKATHLARLYELMDFEDGCGMNVEKADSVLIALYTEHLLEQKAKTDF